MTSRIIDMLTQEQLERDTTADELSILQKGDSLYNYIIQYFAPFDYSIEYALNEPKYATPYENNRWAERTAALINNVKDRILKIKFGPGYKSGRESRRELPVAAAAAAMPTLASSQAMVDELFRPQREEAAQKTIANTAAAEQMALKRQRNEEAATIKAARNANIAKQHSIMAQVAKYERNVEAYPKRPFYRYFNKAPVMPPDVATYYAKKAAAEAAAAAEYSAIQAGPRTTTRPRRSGSEGGRRRINTRKSKGKQRKQKNRKATNRKRN